MGPSKRHNPRGIKSKVKDDTASVPVDYSSMIDLTSSKEEKSKPYLGVNRTKSKAKRADEAGIGKLNAPMQKISNAKEEGKRCRNKTNIVSSTSLSESTLKTSDVKEDGNESVLDDQSKTNVFSPLDEDLLTDSQFNSQEYLLLDSSQDGDQCEVKWDYTSPETMKQLKKMRGKYSAQDVKRIIANFPDVPIKPIPASVHQYRYTFAPKNVDVLPEKNNKVLKAKQRAAKRLQQRERRRGAVEDMILILQQHQEKKEKAGEDARSLEPDDVASDKTDTQEPEDNCPEDDLFQDDNSFLIEATQNLEKLLPIVNKDPANSNAKSPDISDSCDMFSSILPSSSLEYSYSSNKSVIPSSYAGAIGKKLFTASTFGSKPVHKAVSTCGRSGVLPIESKITGQVIHKDSKKPQNGNQQSNHMCNELNSSQRTMFRRHHTFQNKQSLSKQPGKVSSPSLNSPFRKCLSFDDGFSSSYKSSVSDNRKDVSTNKQKSSHNISFDSSLSDDLLLQATEIFDSVCYQTVGSSSNAFCNQRTSVKSDWSKAGCSNAVEKLCKGDDISSTLLSPVRPLKQESSLKRLQESKSSNSPMQSFFKKTFAIDNLQAAKHKSPTGPNSTSTPVKVAKIPDKGSDKPQTNNGSDSFMDDDSFMNDEAMFESQILPILELAETQVSKQESEASSKLTKYSPDEIEKKRLAALQKLRKNDCVHPPVQNTMKVTSPEIIEQTQISSSPRRCSQEEIKRKKQAAQRKLLARTNSAGSIPISQGSTVCPIEPRITNNNVAMNETKCSLDTIKMKREEALKKRRLKLMQIPNRKS